MIPLTNNNTSTVQALQIQLAGAATSTYPTVTVASYIVPQQSKTIVGPNGQIAPDPSEYRASNEFTLLTASSLATIAAAPAQGAVKDIIYINVYNTDTATAIATISILDYTTTRPLLKQSIGSGESLIYESQGIGWHII